MSLQTETPLCDRRPRVSPGGRHDWTEGKRGVFSRSSFRSAVQALRSWRCSQGSRFRNRMHDVLLERRSMAAGRASKASLQRSQRLHFLGQHTDLPESVKLLQALAIDFTTETP